MLRYWTQPRNQLRNWQITFRLASSLQPGSFGRRLQYEADRLLLIPSDVNFFSTGQFSEPPKERVNLSIKKVTDMLLAIGERARQILC